MLFVEELDRARIVKYSENLGKMYAALAMVLLSFILIPFKRQISLYMYMCVFVGREVGGPKEIRPGDAPPGLRKDRTRRKKRTTRTVQRNCQ